MTIKYFRWLKFFSPEARASQLPPENCDCEYSTSIPMQYRFAATVTISAQSSISPLLIYISPWETPFYAGEPSIQQIPPRDTSIKKTLEIRGLFSCFWRVTELKRATWYQSAGSGSSQKVLELLSGITLVGALVNKSLIKNSILFKTRGASGARNTFWLIRYYFTAVARNSNQIQPLMSPIKQMS